MLVCWNRIAVPDVLFGAPILSVVTEICIENLTGNNHIRNQNTEVSFFFF